MLDPDRNFSTYAAWAFAPRSVVYAEGACDGRTCPVQDMITGETHDLSDMDAYAAIVPKGVENSYEAAASMFPVKRESDSFLEYAKD